MLIKVAFFDKYTDERELLKVLKDFEIKIYKKELCFTRELRLRKSRYNTLTFNIKDFRTNNFDICYGVLYTLKVEDIDWFDLIFTSSDYHKRQINVRLFKCNAEEFIKNKIHVGKSVKVINYSAMPIDKYKVKYRDRHSKVNLDKSLFINIIKS